MFEVKIFGIKATTRKSFPKLTPAFRWAESQGGYWQIICPDGNIISSED